MSEARHRHGPLSATINSSAAFKLKFAAASEECGLRKV
jgi:hypothetical protein